MYPFSTRVEESPQLAGGFFKHSKRQMAALVGILPLLVLSLEGCTATAPVLIPDVALMNQSVHADPVEHQLKVSIRPVVTTGFRSEDRMQFGVDLSAYFTAFYVEIQNGLSRQVWVDASQIFLQSGDPPPVQALSETESVEYYRQGDQPQPFLILIPKPIKVEKQEIAKIRDLHLKSATLPPGSRHGGMVYFKKILDRQCAGVLFQMTGIQIEGEEFPQRVQFSYNCSG